jgi:crossover junction endodeoxyribonuclease RusA
MFHPPDRRRWDLDNMLASVKSGLDGLADAIGVDDSFWTLSIAKGEPVPGGAVDVQIGAPTAYTIEIKGTIG